MMGCYKCHSDKELSAKKMNRDGSITFICKTCRNKDYEFRKAINLDRRNKAPLSMKQWTKMAKEKNSQLAKQYRDDSFLEAKGLL